ncbi:VOC family protein [Streptomyces sp. AC627_RSS907]|uniref:VOC family protein n=1 Tax=Streptomyces sp. AC627_RSS907 TaxID=2823684 RepID=UPI0035AFCB49
MRKRTCGDVLGRTFGESSTEYGDHTRCYTDGQAVAAVVPPVPGREDQAQWCPYFAPRDAGATAARIRGAGGEAVTEPKRVGGFGTMCPARDPGGVVFTVHDRDAAVTRATGLGDVPRSGPADSPSAGPRRSSAGPRRSPAGPRSASAGPRR